MRDLWQFSPIGNFEDLNFNKVLDRFYRLGVAGLTRENIQNSMDGRLPSSDLPVLVRIETGEMKRDEIPGIETIMERIRCLEGRNSYTKETIQHMQSEMLKETVTYISFEDENTRGLTGAKYGQSNSKEHTWGIYAYNKGVHFEEEDQDFEASRGGSHGVGKIASNAASDLHMMFFANCDAEGEQHLGGTVQLIEHELKGQCYRSSGYFAMLEREQQTTKFMPFENTFGSVFKKDTRGLKIIIPFLREEFCNEKEIIQAVCDSFFMSIVDKKLIVYVNGLKIDDQEIVSIVNNPLYYNQEIEEMKQVFTPLYVQSYVEEEPKELIVKSIDDTYQFKLYFTYDERIPRGRMAILRTIGMKIEDFKVKNNATKPFNAVLVGGVKEDVYLKSLENESHTAISAKDIKDPQMKKNATRFINNLSKEVTRVIEEKMREHHPANGKIDTGDLIYTMEVQFKNNLSQSFETVKIKKGKNIVSNQPGKAIPVENGPESRKKPENEGRVKPKNTPIRRKGRKPGSSDERRDAELEDRLSYKLTSNRVERIITEKDELIQLNLSGADEIKGARSCHLRFGLIDGMGKEYEDEFRVRENYVRVVDLNTNLPCEVDDHKICDVSVKQGMVRLRLELAPRYNRALKFIYYVEV